MGVTCHAYTLGHLSIRKGMHCVNKLGIRVQCVAAEAKLLNCVYCNGVACFHWGECLAAMPSVYTDTGSRFIKRLGTMHMLMTRILVWGVGIGTRCQK